MHELKYACDSLCETGGTDDDGAKSRRLPPESVAIGMAGNSRNRQYRRDTECECVPLGEYPAVDKSVGGRQQSTRAKAGESKRKKMISKHRPHCRIDRDDTVPPVFSANLPHLCGIWSRRLNFYTPASPISGGSIRFFSNEIFIVRR
ncbi:hypothetical protein [Rikenella microfusus]|uniref:hypothetical protein n=1 Tax=Rikenella microfusus TaxID=28139 RepID=UPI003A8E6242